MLVLYSYSFFLYFNLECSNFFFLYCFLLGAKMGTKESTTPFAGLGTGTPLFPTPVGPDNDNIEVA